ncbi:hypothetical protein Hamer_G012806 [Homarus americanus]|uniref:Uncharacterized protein n=1 Tax=Homarus americanus TaxID=6706 RepID=A0A8J5MXM5_HOMAM|nr:hypothetical protein Hamer_G012806 [Homarus americanus]
MAVVGDGGSVVMVVVVGDGVVMVVVCQHRQLWHPGDRR